MDQNVLSRIYVKELILEDFDLTKVLNVHFQSLYGIFPTRESFLFFTTAELRSSLN